MTDLRPWLGAAALAAAVAMASPIISEFMADNEHTRLDTFGDYSDWIEIYNPDAAAVNLGGWHLTDDTNNLAKWTFPMVSLPSRGTRLVFASGRNTVTNGELHANFRLGKEGEYLALVASNGTAVVSAFAPAYPPQFADVSYGTAVPLDTVVLVSNTSPCRAYVPTNDALGTSWRAAAFDDSAWTTGRFAVGFFTNSSPDLSADLGLDLEASMYQKRTAAYIRAPFVVANAGAVKSLRFVIKHDDAYALFINGTWAISSNAPAVAALGPASTALALHNPSAFETNTLTAILPALVPGTNVLAAYALNLSLPSSDVFFQPRLEAFVFGTNAATGYFFAATPGAGNGGNETVALAEEVTFSHTSGVYTAGFTLALAGAETGQVIRYTLDGSLPGAGSTLYTGPVSVATSRYVRARVFAPNGQGGPPATAQYTFLDPLVQSFTSSVPLVILRNVDPTRPGAVPTNADIACYVQIIDRATNGMAALAGPVAFSSRGGLNVRGSSSQTFPKKSYALEFWDEDDDDDAKKPFLDMPAGSDWVLVGCYSFDRTYVHDALMFELSRQAGRWAPRTRFVEAYLCTNAFHNVRTNDYIGLYVVEEKIKPGRDRVDITELEPEDTGLPDVTGGYLLKIDRPDPDEFRWFTWRIVPPTSTTSRLVVQDPKGAELVPAQRAYITNYVQAFEDSLYSADPGNLDTGYPRYIDVPSWIDHHLLNVLPMNVDALRLSAYMWKERGGRLYAGPVWDFDRSLDSYDPRDDAGNTWLPTGDGTDFFGYCWWARLFASPAFYQQWVDRWQELRRGPLTSSNMVATVDRLVTDLGSGPPVRDSSRWPTNMPLRTNQNGAVVCTNYVCEIAWLKNWVTNRAAWMDAQFAPCPGLAPPTGVMATGETFSITGGAGTVYYTVDGSDPRLPAGGLAPDAVAYTGAVPLATSSFVTARSLSGTNWSGPAKALYLVGESFAASGEVAVSEIHYNPLGPSAAEFAALPDALPELFEFVELKNIGTNRVNLYACSFDEGRPFAALKLGPVSLAPGERAVAVRDRRAFPARYGTGLASRVAGEWGTGALDDNGEGLTLRARDGSVIQSFAYQDTDAWPGRADGKGSSLEYAAEDFRPAAVTNPASWRSSSEVHGTPAAAGAGPDGRVLINEWLAHTDMPFVDAVELFNPGPTNVAVGGWLLSDCVAPESADDFRQFVFPSNDMVVAGGWRAYDETEFAPNGPWNPGAGTPGPGEFRLDAAHGEELWLLEGDGQGNPRRFVDHVTFGASGNGEAQGRWPDGADAVYPLSTQTLVNAAATNVPRPALGAANAPPRVGPVVIGEVHYHPSPEGRPPFIEVINAGAVTEDLSQWTLRGDVDWDFAPGLSLAPGGVLVLAPFSPADAAASNAFASAYLPPTDVRLLGPWPTNDALAASGRVVLYRADDPPIEEPWFYPQILEDEVEHEPLPPWPAEAGGTGRSLTRLQALGSGLWPTSWVAEVPSPGWWAPVFPAWAAFHGLSGVPGADTDGDGAPDLLEFASGGNATNPADGGWSSPMLGRLPPVAGHRRWLPRAGVTSYMERTTNLVDWAPSPDGVVTAGPAWEIRVVPVHVEPSAPHNAYRLKAELSP